MCINIYFLFIVRSLFSRGASSNYFFGQKVLSTATLVLKDCFLWCWFSFKISSIKSSDFKNPPWLSSATQIVAEITFTLSQIFQSEIFFWMKKNVWWKKGPPKFDIKVWFVLSRGGFKMVSTGWGIEIQGFMGTNHLFCSSKTAQNTISIIVEIHDRSEIR